MTPNRILFTLLICFGLGCSHSKTQPTSLDSSSQKSSGVISKKNEHNSGLTREMALTRARQLARISYSLWFGLGYEHEDFDGRATLNFDLRPKAAEASDTLILDFLEGSIKAITLNGNALSAEWIQERYDGAWITFKLSELNTTGNRLEISYIQKYSRSGNGLHRFLDPEDKQVYIYSNLEPYNARRVFPCFDQPDLKASFEVTAEVPAEWMVVSNVLERDVLKVGPRRSWAFAPSTIFSTYLFALAAGPFSESKQDAEGIPLRILTRKTLAKYVDAKDIFQTVVKGLEFYSQEFGFAYPFSKLDLILVPEFNIGGMENVAAITLSERNIYRSAPNQLDLLNRRTLILHEIAHMWFGNLVTMRWWNGLWLNESFATFASYLALEKTGLSPLAWQQFLASMKYRAYQEDQLETTHPIEMSVSNTDQAFANFDGITYGKGASVLKQLRFYLGEDDFREGMLRYFQRYSYRNASLTDLIRVLAEASGANLIHWQSQWLQSAGMNRLIPSFTCDPETKIVTQFLIRQENHTYSKELRTHKVRVAFYDADAQGKYGANKNKTWDVVIQKETNELKDKEMLKLKCPEFVMINDEDMTYANVQLDAVSLAFAQKNMHRLTNPLTRLQVAIMMWDMLLDQKVSPKYFSATALEALQKEKDLILLKRWMSWAFKRHARYESVSSYLNSADSLEYRKKLESLASTQLTTPNMDFNLRSLWFKFFAEVAFTEEAAQKIEKLLDGKIKLSGFQIEKDRRWELIQALAQTGAASALIRIEAELSLDNSQAAKSGSLIARALISHAESKRSVFDNVNQNLELSTNQKQLSLSSLWTVDSHLDANQTKSVVEQYQTELKKLNQSGQSDFEDYVSAYTIYGYPLQCTTESANRLEDIIDSISNIRPAIKKELSIMKFQEARCAKLKKP